MTYCRQDNKCLSCYRNWRLHNTRTAIFICCCDLL